MSSYDQLLDNETMRRSSRRRGPSSYTAMAVISGLATLAIFAVLGVVVANFVKSENRDNQLLSRSCEGSVDPACAQASYDYIIVGLGSAGSTAAYYLSNNDSHTVLGLEWGENENDNIFVKRPFENSDTENKYGFGLNFILPAANPRTTDSIAAADYNGPAESSAIKGPPTHTGRGWGGSSLHHYLSAWWQTDEFDDKIATDHASAEWAAATSRPIKSAIERYMPADAAVGAGGRGSSGRWNITKPTDYDETADYMGDVFNGYVDGTVNGVDTTLTTPVVSDINAPGQSLGRARHLQNNLFNGDRMHAGITFLGPDVVGQTTGLGVNGRKLTIKSKALVRRILFDETTMTAKQVEVIIDGQRVRYEAKKKIIISAGAFRTPGILERSGVGSAAVLGEIGVKPVVEMPAVGENLLIHPIQIAIANVNASITPRSNAVALKYPGTNPYGLSRYVVNRWINGPLRALDPYLPSDKFVALFGGNYDAANTVAFLCYNYAPTSKGSVHAINDEASAIPELIRNILTTNEDVVAARQMMRFFGRMETYLDANNPALDFNLAFPKPGTNYNDDAEVDMYANAVTIVADHPMGTCRMGKTALGNCVDPKLHVWGVKNLMVADNSIWPIPVDSGTTLPAVYVGYQAAKFAQQ